MKQVVFAVILMAMASLTGCLNGDDSSDITEDNTDTKDDGTIEPVETNGGYTPPEESSIFFYEVSDDNEPAVLWTCIETGCTYVPNEIYENYTSPSGNIVNYSWDDYNINSDLFLIYGDGYQRPNSTGPPFPYPMDRYGERGNFQGWVNKTGNTVTIEGLPIETMAQFEEAYPIPVHEEVFDSCGGMAQYDDGQPLHSLEAINNPCYITIFGQDGLHMTTQFVLSSNRYVCGGTEYLGNLYDCMLLDSNASSPYLSVIRQFTVIIDLPFEPVSFTLTDNNGIERTRLF